MKLNDRGSSYIDVLVSIILIFILIKTVSVFEVSTLKSKSQTLQKLELATSINNIVSDAYNVSDWRKLSDKTIETNVGELYVNYDLEDNLTSYSTQKLNILFKLKDLEKDIILERSCYIE